MNTRRLFAAAAAFVMAASASAQTPALEGAESEYRRSSSTGTMAPGAADEAGGRATDTERSKDRARRRDRRGGAEIPGGGGTETQGGTGADSGTQTAPGTRTPGSGGGTQERPQGGP